jgi:radical SAM superfamily enzyme YgiQ (UPF0313 family)
VADRTLSANYKILFEGIFATMQTTQVPELAMRHFVSPAVATDSQRRAAAAPLGLRRLESALLKFTNLQRRDIVCTTPEALPGLLGPWVKVVGFSSSDPLGMGMSNTTTANFWKGQLYTRYWTKKMLTVILEAKKKYNFKVVAGGAGAWQLTRYSEQIAEDCIDIIFEGYFENLGPKLFENIVNDRPTEKYFCERKTCIEKAQPITNASMLGIIELSRGCGRGCKFCSMAGKKMEHLPPDTIMSDLQTNLANGITAVVSGSEDFFRYGSKGLKPDFDKLENLLRQMQQNKHLSFMQIDHANITSVMQLTDEQLREIRKLLTWNKKTDYLWVNMGVESANGHLVAANCPGKISPYSPEDWEQIVRETAERMERAGFFSVFSIVLGLEGETPDDIAKTLELVKYLGTKNAVIFPVFFEPLTINQPRFTLENMRADHLELYRTCYEINFKMVPRLFWDNQRAGGVSWIKRVLIQLLGKRETMTWRRTFKKIQKRLEDSGSAIEETGVGNAEKFYCDNKTLQAATKQCSGD